MIPTRGNYPYKMKVLVSHPTGNANVRAAVTAMERAALLDRFYTAIATDSNSFWFRALPVAVRNELTRRAFPIDKQHIRAYPFREMVRLASRKFGLNVLTTHETGKFSVDAVYRSIDNKVARDLRARKRSHLPESVYAYEDGALEIFRAAKKLNVHCVYDLPKGYYKAERDILGKQREERPDWAVTLAGFKDSAEKLARKDEEIRLADRIIVASSFTQRTLAYYSGALPPIDIIPYGFPPIVEKRAYDFSHSRKLRLLFVGSLSQLKGLANVLEAVEILKNNVELTIVGRKSTEACEPLNEGLAKHRYIKSLPHSEVLREMARHDVLLFPSLFEGFGLVVTEAMSQGTPVITTQNTCGGDIIDHDKNGWIVSPGSTEELTRQIDLILRNPDSVKKAGIAAIGQARQRPWNIYGEELVKTLIKLKEN